MADDFTVANYQPLDILYRDGVKYQTIKSFYNNQEVERIYQGNVLIYQKQWFEEIILPSFMGEYYNDSNENYYEPPVYNLYPVPEPDEDEWVVEYDQMIQENPSYMDDPDFYPVQNYIDYTSKNEPNDIVTCYDIVQPGNILYFREIEYPETQMSISNFISTSSPIGKVKIINSTADMTPYDELGYPVEYQWLENIYTDIENNIFVSLIMPYGNFIVTQRSSEWNSIKQDYDYIYTESEQWGALCESYDNVWGGYRNNFENVFNYPLYVYCENASNIYYNSDAGAFSLGCDDLTEGPKYDYVTTNFSISRACKYVNVNFNSYQGYNDYYNKPIPSGSDLIVALNTPSLRNMSYLYQYLGFLQKAYCGRYTENMVYAYSYSNLSGKAACGNNVTNMAFAYYQCSKLAKPNCGRNVINMAYAFQQCVGLSGMAACGNNVIDMTNAYSTCINLIYPNIGPNVIYAERAFQWCTNLKRLIITPNLNQGTSSIYGFGGNYDKLEEIIIERNTTNANIPNMLGTGGYVTVYNSFNLKNIIIRGGNNFLSLWNNGVVYNEETNKLEYSYYVKEGYSPGVFYYAKDLKNVIIETPNLKEVSGWFVSSSLNSIENISIPSSVEVYSNTFFSTNITRTYHNNYGPVWMFNTYSACANLRGELYIPETAEFISGIARSCSNLQSIKFARNCKIPFIGFSYVWIRNNIIGNNTYEINGNFYNNYYYPPFEGCFGLENIQFSEYMISPQYILYGLASHVYNSQTRQYELVPTSNIRNIVFYNNDDNTPKDLYYSLWCFNSQHQLNVYVPDSINENSFNYLFYHDPEDMHIFGDYTRKNGNNIQWTTLSNGYYNELYNIYVYNDYDYINDRYPT